MCKKVFDLHRPRRVALLLASLLASSVTSAAYGAEESAPVTPACLEELATFTAEQDLVFDPAKITFGARWAGAGHEIKRLPGHRAHIPVERCNGTLAVDLSDACRIVKSRGEGGCKRTFPLTFH